LKTHDKLTFNCLDFNLEFLSQLIVMDKVTESVSDSL